MGPNKLLAQVTHPINPQGYIDPNKYGSPTGTLEKIISQAIGVLTIVAFIYFAIQIILAGYAYITSQGDPKNIETSRKRLTEGVLGVFVVVAAVGIARLIGYLAGIDNVLDLSGLFTRLGLTP